MRNSYDGNKSLKSEVVEIEISSLIFIKQLSLNCVGGELLTFLDDTWDREKAKLIEEIKTTIKAGLRVESESDYSKHLHTLIKQGEFLKISQLEQQDPIWKSFIHNLKKHFQQANF